MFTGLLITLLIVAALATTAVGAVTLMQRKRELPGSRVKALPGAGGDRLLERTIRDLRAGDVLVYEGKDYIVEGVVQYDEDGHRWSAGRMVDGSTTHWLVVGLERGGNLILRLVDEDKSLEIEGFPPETLLVGDVRFALSTRGTATARMSGDTGLIHNSQPGSDLVERCRWWLYETPGDETLVLEQWGNAFRALRGVKMSPALIELIPGS